MIAGAKGKLVAAPALQARPLHTLRLDLSGPPTCPHRPAARRSRHRVTISAAATANAPPRALPALPGLGRSTDRAQRIILECLSGVSGRGKGGMSPEAQAAFDAAVAELERSGRGVKAPTASPLIEGRWRLLYTSRPGSASPIQRTFTGVDSFSIFQEILFQGEDVPRVNNVVEFGAAGTLKVEAEASTDARPLPGFTPRSGAGLPFGIMGVSSTAPPAEKDMRIDFQFDKAAFRFKALPFAIPYPVPFKLLCDERKGWLDVTYMSPDGKFRLSRGNKGTLFVLVKEDPPRDRLLGLIEAGASDGDIEAAAEALAALGDGERNPAGSPLASGSWRLVWTVQGTTANPLQRQLASSVRNWQIISEDGARLENRVQLLPGVLVRALARAEQDGPARTGVIIDEVVLQVGGLKFKLPINTDARGFVDWLYLDEGMRVTRGSKGSLFVHKRDLTVKP